MTAPPHFAETVTYEQVIHRETVRVGFQASGVIDSATTEPFESEAKRSRRYLDN